MKEKKVESELILTNVNVQYVNPINNGVHVMKLGLQMPRKDFSRVRSSISIAKKGISGKIYDRGQEAAKEHFRKSILSYAAMIASSLKEQDILSLLNKNDIHFTNNNSLCRVDLQKENKTWVAWSNMNGEVFIKETPYITEEQEELAIYKNGHNYSPQATNS